MVKFIKYLFKVLLIIVISAFLLDSIYTKIYENSKERNKIQAVINGKQLKLDVLILGSSRANNHFVTSEFTKKKIVAHNFGMSGASLEESALLLQLMINRKWVLKNVLLEVDLNINTEKFSDGTRASFMPYFRENAVSNYYRKMENFNHFYYFPFYRYIKYETKIGFREMFFCLINKKSTALQNGGFYGLNNSAKNMSYDLTGYKPKPNKNYDFIKNLCLKNKINLIVVTTPICSNTKNRTFFADVKKFHPEIQNFENAVIGDQYFSSCGHLNLNGARKFTKIIIANCFEKNKRLKTSINF